MSERDPWAENPEAWKGGPTDAEVSAAAKRLRRTVTRLDDSLDIFAQRLRATAEAFRALGAALPRTEGTE